MLRTGCRWLVAAGCMMCLEGTVMGQDTDSRLKAQHVETSAPVAFDYWEYLPDGYAEDAQKRWPLLLFLHGAGERGNDLKLVLRHGPPKRVLEGAKFPFVIVAPQCPAGKWWEPVSLDAFLNAVLQKYRIDADRVYVTGLSMGGYGTWSLIAYAPQRFAAAAPICGGGLPFLVRNAKNVPVWVFHGAKDGVVPIEESERLVRALKRAGGTVRFTVYPDAGHDSWTATYENDELYRWLLSHRRGQPAADAAQ
ncbi:MAG: phospholipase [Planctomycetota bacterium]|nr:MAG: phospholipase [Planctomycetota bacterium]